MKDTLSKIIRLINADQFYEAEQELRKIYNTYSDSFDVNYLLGAATLSQRKYNIALKCYEKCWTKKKVYDVANNLSYLFLKTQFYDQSIQYGQEAISLNPNGAHAYQNISSCYFSLSDYEKAKEFCIKAIEIRGGFESSNFLSTHDLVVLYSNILLAQKDKSAFISYAQKSLSMKYIQRLMITLLREDRNLITEDHLKMVHEVIENAPKLEKRIERNTGLSDAYFFLAEYYDSLDQDKSENYYITANQYISDMQRESLYKRQKFAKGIFNYFKNFDYSQLKNQIDPKKGEGLIFILGMPRSGTTLTESILSTAEDLVAGGEKAFFSLQLFETLNDLANQSDFNFDIEFAKNLGDRYLEHIKMQRNGKKMFVDKLPENYLYTKFIQSCLPGARFIHCQRDPWDNAISLFKQNYSINIFYASSFFGIATEFANQEFLMSHWKAQDQDNTIIEISYEDLVKKESEMSEKLWKFLGIPGAYEPSKRKNYVGYTASMQQVSKDIYDTSIGKNGFSGQKSTFFDDLEKQRKYWNNQLN
jgi:tetratricopeptide (TPR) repeat protein